MTNEQAQTQGNPTAASWMVGVGLILIAFMGIRTISNSDFWTHLAGGQWILAHGIPRTEPLSFATSGGYVNNSWLYDVLLALVWKIGRAPLTILLHVAAVVAAFGLLAHQAARRSGFRAAGWSLLLCSWILLPLFAVRPMILCLVFPALFILLLSNGPVTRKSLITLAVLQVAWTNLHASFLLGPFIAALFALENALPATRKADAAPAQPAGLSLLAVAGILLAATLLNPYLHKLPLGTVSEWLSPGRNIVVEWISPFSTLFDFALPKYLVTAALIIAASGFVLCKQKLPVALTTLAVGAAFLLVRSPRFADIGSLMLLPFAAISVRAIEDFVEGNLAAHKDKASVAGRIAFVLLCLLSAFAVLKDGYYRRTGSASTCGLGLAEGLLPSEALENVIGRPGFPRPMLNIPMDGGYLACKLPGQKIFTDVRAPVYGAEFYQTFTRGLMGDPEAWAKVVDTHKPQSILLNCAWPGSGPALRNLVMSGRWQMLYFDGLSAVLLPVSPVYTRMASDVKIKAMGLNILEDARKAYAEAVKAGKAAGNDPRLIGAGSAFQSLSRFREAAAVYRLLAEGSPTMHSAVLNLGICLCEQSEYEEALPHLEKAARNMSRHPLAWLWLSKAYQKVGRTEDHDKALAKARGINPQLADAFFTTNSTTATTTLPGSDKLDLAPKAP